MTTKTTPLVSVAVNNTTIPHVTYKGQPVLTTAAIAEAHGTDQSHIGKTFQRNKERFVEGVDFFKLSPEQAKALGFPHARSIRATNCPPNMFAYSGTGLLLFTRSGYLMLTKPLTDPKAWDVQRTLVDCYFKQEEVQAVLKETGGVYVSEEAMFDDDDLLIAKALKAASLKIERYEARLSEMQPKVSLTL